MMIVEDVLDRPPKLPYGSPHTAKFVSPKKVLRKDHMGFCLTGTKRLSQSDSYKHAIIYGSSGTGKSSTVLLPSIYTMFGSFVINDPSGELWYKSAAYLARRRGYLVKRLNFSKPLVSDGFNPVVHAIDEPGINKLAELVIKIALGNDPQATYWNESAVDLLRFLIRVIRTRDPKYHTFAAIYRLLHHIEAAPDQFLDLVKESGEEDLITQAKAFLARDTKLRSSVISTVQAAVQRYSDPDIALVSSFDSLNLSQLKTQKTAIYVQIPAQDHEYYRTPNSVFWEVLFNQLLKELPQSGELPTYCLLDEIGWLSLPNLPTYMAVARKYFGILLSVQDASQLIARYRKEGATTIEANAWSKLFFTAQSPKAAEELARILGTTEIITKEGQKIVRSLMSHAEIRMMDPFRGILLCGNKSPMWVKLSPYYMQSKMKRYAEYSRNYPLPEQSKHPSMIPSEELQARTDPLNHGTEA